MRKKIQLIIKSLCFASITSMAIQVAFASQPSKDDLPITLGTPTPVVTPDNWYWAPNNVWSWSNTRRLFPTANISHGDGTVTKLPKELQDPASIAFEDPVTNKAMTVDEMLTSTWTDSFIVLHNGKIIGERYFNYAAPDQPHLIMSITKSVIGTLAGIFISEGSLDPDKKVTYYLPDLEGTVYENSTVQNVLDMQVAGAWNFTESNPYDLEDQAAGWLPKTPESAAGLRQFVHTMTERTGEDGEKFFYLDPNPLVIGWILQSITGNNIADILSERIWSKLGAEEDAYVLLDRRQTAYTTPGLNMTLRDLARFGLMMANNGHINGKQIVPKSGIEDIRNNGSTSAWKASGSDFAKAIGYDKNASYRNFWWVANQNCGRYSAVGLGGQLMVIDPAANMVIVKFSSHPKPQTDHKARMTAMAGIDAIIKKIAGHTCNSQT